MLCENDVKVYRERLIAKRQNLRDALEGVSAKIEACDYILSGDD